MAKATKTKRPPTLSEQLRAAIADSGLSIYRVAKESGVPQSTLQRFVTDDLDQRRDMRLSNADAIAAFLGLALVKKR